MMATRVVRVLTAVALVLATACGDKASKQVFTLSDVHSPTNVPSQEIGGTKPAGASVWLLRDGGPQLQIVPADKETTWSFLLQLQEGENGFVVFGRDKKGKLLGDVSAMIVLDTEAPGEPSILCAGDPPPGPGDLVATDARQQTLSGTKEPGTSIWINGNEAVPYDNAVTWQATITLELGFTDVFATAQDAAGNESNVVQACRFYYADQLVGCSVDDAPAYANTYSVTLGGSKDSGASVLIRDEERVTADAETTWSTSAELPAEGLNTFNVVCALEGSRSLPQVVNVIRDTLVPQAPGIPATLYGCGNPYALCGAKEVGAGVEVAWAGGDNNGASLPPDSSAAFCIGVPLVAGSPNLFTVAARDLAGNLSELAIVNVVEDCVVPVVGITSPPSGMRVTGAVDVEGTAFDDNGVAVVQVSTDGATWTDATAVDPDWSSWSVQVDSSVFANGVGSVIAARALDVAGNVSAEASIVLYVLNDPVEVSLGGQGEARAPAISVSGFQTFLVWVAPDPGPNTDDDVFLAIFDGATFSEPILVSDAAADGQSRNPAVVAFTDDGGTRAYVVWQEEGNIDGDGVVEFDVVGRLWDGAALGPYELISNGSNGSGSCASPLNVDQDSQTPEVAAWVNPIDTTEYEVHAVWQDEGNLDGGCIKDRDVHHAARVAGVWGAPALLSSHAADGASVSPDVAVDALGRAHVVWQENGDLDNDGTQDNDVVYRFHNSSSWSATLHVVSQGPIAPFAGSSVSPRIAADLGASVPTVHIVWSDDGDVAQSGLDEDILYVYSDLTETEGAIGNAVLLSDHVSDGASRTPDIAVDGEGSLHVVWVDTGDVFGVNVVPQVYYRAFNGAWTPYAHVSVTNDTSSFFAPAIAADAAGTAHIAWQDRSDVGDSDGEYDIFYFIQTP